VKKQLLSRVLLFGALVLISWLSFTPSPPEQTIVVWDKLNHFIAFLSLAFLSDFSFPQAFKTTWTEHLKQYRIQWSSLALYGVAIEVCQWWLGYRVFELWDIVADWLGILAYLLVVLLLRITLRKR